MPSALAPGLVVPPGSTIDPTTGIPIPTPPAPLPTTQAPAPAFSYGGGVTSPPPPPDPALQWIQQPSGNQLSVTPTPGVPMGPSTTPRYTTGPIQIDPQSYSGVPSNQLGGGGQQGASAISNFVYGLESSYGKGAQVNQQKYPDMVDYNYGQYPEFGKQYGTGQAGVDNYAAQVLKANPNATIGDFYSSYVLNTGDPSKLSTPDQLKAKNPLYYQNLVNNLNAHGYNFNTPLSSLVSTQGNQVVTGVGAGGELTYAPAPTDKQQVAQTTLQPATAQTDPQSGPSPDDLAKQAQKQMVQMQLMAALRGFQLHPVPYDPSAVLKVSHIYGYPDTAMHGLPNIGTTIPRLQLQQDVTAISPQRVPQYRPPIGGGTGPGTAGQT